MRILVTGGAGYIGSHACKALAAAGGEPVVYDNLITGRREFVRFGPFEYGDVNDVQRLRQCMRKHRPDAVIHFAALSEVGESVKNPGAFFRNNVGGSLSLLEAMRDEGIPAIVASSSCAVYGQPKTSPIAEDCPANPISPYGAAKLFMERMLADFEAAHGIKWTSLRYFNAAGSSPDGEIGELHDPETHLIPRAMLAALGRAPELKIFGSDYPTPDGTCGRDYIDVEDLARAHILAARRLLGGGGSIALNLGSGRSASVKEIIAGVEAVSGRKVPASLAPRRPGDPALLVADASRAERELGWKAEKKLSESLENAWNFLAGR